MKTLRIGIAPLSEMRARTLAVARGELKLGPDEPGSRRSKAWRACCRIKTACCLISSSRNSRIRLPNWKHYPGGQNPTFPARCPQPM